MKYAGMDIEKMNNEQIINQCNWINTWIVTIAMFIGILIYTLDEHPIGSWFIMIFLWFIIFLTYPRLFTMLDMKIINSKRNGTYKGLINELLFKKVNA
jgi:hypothetical protein